ncbi:uncharacterized protein LOC108734598 [Agrilus planipennis]|uniref:Uncharacterized protein LOC108734598 n=1 Tax=Agrilus planipennis TaxID=224129 RepID=A0A1W4WCM8_AGRPL|nr:uncharacterized protein LOC108734598 [Agrilus planipennis]
MRNGINAVLWCLIMIIFSYVIAIISGIAYVFATCLHPFYPSLTECRWILLEGLNFPQFCAMKMMNEDPVCFDDESCSEISTSTKTASNISSCGEIKKENPVQLC